VRDSPAYLALQSLRQKVGMRKKLTAKVETRAGARIRAQGGIRRLRGKVKWEGDLEQSRLSRFPSAGFQGVPTSRPPRPPEER
jgi:hypothetical protein